MKKAKRKAKARRKRTASSKTSVGSLLKRIAKLFEIPRQAIVIVGPNRRRVQANAKIARLRQMWD